MQAPHTHTLGDYLMPLFHYKWRAMVIVLLALVVAGAYLNYAPRVYESEAKLLVRIGRENAGLGPLLRGGETIGLSVSRVEEINSIVAHLKSRVIAEKVFDMIHGDEQHATPRDRDKALRSFQRDIVIGSPRASTVITIWAKGETPEQAQMIVDAMLEVFLEEHIRVHRVTESYDFFAQQSNVLKAQLEDAEIDYRNAKNNVGIASIDGRRLALEDQVSKIEQETQSVSAALAGSTAKISARQDAIANLPEQLLQQLVGGSPNDGLADMRVQLFELRVQQQELKSRFSETHPKAVAVQRQLSAVEEKLGSQEQDVERSQLIAALLSSELANLAFLEAQSKKLADQLASLTAEAKQLNNAEVEITQLKRSMLQLEREYLSYVETLESARMDQQLQADQITNLSVLQPATFVADPISPQTSITLALGGLAGIGLASLLVMFLDQRERRSVGQMGPDGMRGQQYLPVFATIPHLSPPELNPAVSEITFAQGR